jgi:hypothetical protein
MAMSRLPRDSAKAFVDDCLAAKGPVASQADVAEGCDDAAHYLFAEIYDRLGVADAWRIFGKYRPPKSRDEIKQWQEDNLLSWYDLRHSVARDKDGKPKLGWGVKRIAKEIAEENASRKALNKTLKPEQRQNLIGSGSTSTSAIEQALWRALRKRKRLQKKYRERQEQLKAELRALPGPSIEDDKA